MVSLWIERMEAGSAVTPKRRLRSCKVVSALLHKPMNTLSRGAMTLIALFRRSALRVVMQLALLVSSAGALSVSLAASGEAATPGDLFRAAAIKSEAVDHQPWTRLLSIYVKPGGDGINRVDYAAFKRDGHVQLKAYVAKLQALSPASLTRPEQFALLINLYNAKTIDVVLDRYPVKSIRDISLGGGLITIVTGGPWKAKLMKIGGLELSLDDIENEILRPVFKDPRVHYAINCASIGCPNLQREAFTGANLETLLDSGARSYVNHPRGARVDAGKLAVSSIYHWFKADFGGDDRGVIAHLKRYAEPAQFNRLSSVSEISGHAYDWRLNDFDH